MNSNQNQLMQRAKALFDQGRLAESAECCKQYLASNPRDITAAHFYGETAIAMGFFNDAIIIYQIILKLDPRDAKAQTQLARQFHALRDYQNALKHAEAALSIAPNLATPLMVLGAIELERGDEEKAKILFDRVRELGIDAYTIDSLYADALLARGNFDEAIDLLRKLIDEHPDEVGFYAKLAKSKPLDVQSPDVKRIYSLLDENGNLRGAIAKQAHAEVEAYSALYKLESDLKNYTSAFKYLQQAKEYYLKERPAVHHRTAQDQYHEQIRIFDSAFVESRAKTASQSDDPIFVVGMPRSGTTLLERILSTNSEILAAGELTVLDRIQQEVSAKIGKNQDDLAALEKVPEKMWREIGEEYIKRARQGLGKGKYFVDKLPGNFVYIGLIKAILPKARIIHLCRDPVATCFSMYEQDFAQRHDYANDLQSLGKTYLAYHKLMQHWRDLFGDGIIEVQYESMVADPIACIERLSEQLGLELDSSAMSTAQSSGAIHTASYWQARQPVNTRSIDRWQHYREQLQPLLEVLEPILGADK